MTTETLTRTTSNQEISNCYHCGDSCGHKPILFEEKPFCCEGCKMVFQILSENELCNYYELESHPGISLKTKDQGNRFEYLESPQIIQRLLDFQDETQSHITFYLPQIHCSSCIWLLEKLYKLTDGVQRSQVNFLKRELSVVFEHDKISLKALVELLATIGYEPEINLQDLKKKKGSRYNRRLLYQLGIAGFAFGNIMLLSFPEYLAINFNVAKEFSTFFGYLNLVLSIPVLVYSAQDYLRSAWYSLKQKGLNIDVPISLGILTLFTRSAYEILAHTGPGYLDAMVGLVFFLLIGKWFQNRTYATLSFEREYESYFPVAVMKKVGEEWKSTALPELQAGDRVLIRNQELIPADCLLINGQANVDYSFVTGESDPVRRKLGETIYAGGRQIGASIELELTKAVDQSYLTKLWNADAFEQQTQAQHSLFQLADKIGKYFTLTILTIAFASGIAWWIMQPDMAIHVFTSVLIIACPCALALTSPFTFGNALRILGKKGFYLKNPQIVERMANISHIVFDKTGTLTHGQQIELTALDQPLSETEKQLLYNLSLQSAHPISRAISMHLEGTPKISLSEIEELAEIPGKGIKAIIAGHAVALGSAAFMLDETSTKDLATLGSYFAIDGRVLAHTAMQTSYRPQLKAIIDRLKASYSFGLLSGDHAGEQARLEQSFPEGTPMYFQQSPFDKLAYIQSAQEKGEQVMMIGDGLNDAGALKQSDVGIAVSEDINNFSPACDAILDAKSFELIPRIFRFSQKSYQLVKVGFIFSLIYNIVGLGFAVQGLLSPVVAAILMPLSSVSIIAFAVGSTYWVGKRIFS